MTSVDTVQEPAEFFWTVAIYLIDRRYGGPEEGGWYYTCGARQDRVFEEAGEYGVTRTFVDEDEAIQWCEAANERLDATVNKGRRPISSVLSDGIYRAEMFIQAGPPPEHYPAVRPHYE